MLSYLLENKEVNGVRTVERFRKKFEDDPGTFMQVDRATKGETETILFNIDYEGSINKDKTAVLRVFAKVFYNHLGFFGNNLKVAMLEQYITQQGKMDEFCRLIEEKKGKPWTEVRKAFAFNGKFIKPALAEALDISEEDANNWFNDKSATELSVSQLVEDINAYNIYKPDADGIIPICDDEYFEDDMMGRFVEFVRVVYGDSSLEDNLRFIANALGGKGQPKEVIRNYFLNDFYADHCKIYQKRPIYWLFDSGKKNGFKCLIYMHRYQPDTIARIRTDYVHEQQARYRTAIEGLEKQVAAATSTGERVKLTKQLNKVQAQDAELHQYEEKVHALADQMIKIDLDDGVKHNYEIFKDVLAKIK